MSERTQQYQTRQEQVEEKRPALLRALQLLIRMGFEYLTPEQIMEARANKSDSILLENILQSQLSNINRVNHKGHDKSFSKDNIKTAIARLKTLKFDGLQKTNEAMYDLLTLGASLHQTVDGIKRTFNLAYIDWANPDNNLFHVAVLVPVERSRSFAIEVVDLVLYVNGIPFVTIEFGPENKDVRQPIAATLDKQKNVCIPHLYTFVQIVIAACINDARYATVGTTENFWSRWSELQPDNEKLLHIMQQPVEQHTRDNLLASNIGLTKSMLDKPFTGVHQNITEQDMALYSLCRPERLIELIFKFTVFDNGIKKIARYQQYFVIKSTLERVQHYDQQGRREGGMIWHTQGSGKSLTMVMLVRNLLLHQAISQPRIVLVSDRLDLDRQLANTFMACGMDPQRATSGKHLLELVSELKAGLVTTLIQKFDKAMKIRNFKDDATDIFMLVDESHRSNFGLFAARMRQMFTHACYLGFTGTPLLKKEKNSFDRFGGLIEPHYSIQQAVRDKAVVPLLYEARHTEIKLNSPALNEGFDHYTEGLTRQQKIELKKRFATASQLNKVEQVVYQRALDISHHYRTTWQGTGFKAQLVAPDKETALLYHKYLQSIGLVSSELVISAPEEKEHPGENGTKPAASVVAFWQTMMQQYGNKEEYEKQIINQYRNGATPEILIVVSKLLTGFDAPRNTVLYLCATLKEHTLLQAVARVNRICENKRFGFVVDYVNTLGELDKALNLYSALSEFDVEDISGAITSLRDEAATLPQAWLELWSMFEDLRHESREECWELRLEDSLQRENFYQRLRKYSQAMAMALSSKEFTTMTNADTLMHYKDDLQRFYQLKYRVKRRFHEGNDYRDYDPGIKKLLDIYLRSGKVVPLNKPLNLFEEQSYTLIQDENESYSDDAPAIRAAFMVQATKLDIGKSLSQEPAIYDEFSDLLESVINAHRNKRLSDVEYLEKVANIRENLASRQNVSISELYLEQERGLAIYKAIMPVFDLLPMSSEQIEQIATETALTIQTILSNYWKVNFWNDLDAQNRVRDAIDDFLYDELLERHALELSVRQKDAIIENALDVAKPDSE